MAEELSPLIRVTGFTQWRLFSLPKCLDFVLNESLSAYLRYLKRHPWFLHWENTCHMTPAWILPHSWGVWWGSLRCGWEGFGLNLASLALLATGCLWIRCASFSFLFEHRSILCCCCLPSRASSALRRPSACMYLDDRFAHPGQEMYFSSVSSTISMNGKSS